MRVKNQLLIQQQQQQLIQPSIDRFNQESDRPYQLAMSVGVLFCALTEDASLGHLLAQADKLMYDHKRMKGR